MCEEALKVLRVSAISSLHAFVFRNNLKWMVYYLLFEQNSRRRPVKGILHISGDGLRVVEEDTKVKFFPKKYSHIFFLY